MLDCIDQPLGGCAGEVVVGVAGCIKCFATLKPVLDGAGGWLDGSHFFLSSSRYQGQAAWF